MALKLQSLRSDRNSRALNQEKAASIGGSDKDPEPEDGAEARGRPDRRQKNSLRVDEAISIRKARITRKRRYGERRRGSERGSEPCVECDQSRVRGGEDREEAKGHT